MKGLARANWCDILEPEGARLLERLAIAEVALERAWEGCVTSIRNNEQLLGQPETAGHSLAAINGDVVVRGHNGCEVRAWPWVAVGVSRPGLSGFS